MAQTVHILAHCDHREEENLNSNFCRSPSLYREGGCTFLDKMQTPLDGAKTDFAPDWWMACVGGPTWNYLADSIYRLCSLDSPNVSLCILVNHFKQAVFTRLSAALADISSWQAASLQNCQCGFKLALGLHAWKRKTEKIYEIWSPK